MEFIATTHASTSAVPLSAILVLLLLWFGTLAPLVSFGAYYGYKQNPIKFPIPPSMVTPRPRSIPDQPWFMSSSFTLTLSGILPFSACASELFLLMSDVWLGQYYSSFKFLFLVLGMVMMTIIDTTLLLHYFQLCTENHHWWWRSFATGGSLGLFIFMYSIIVYYNQVLEANTMVAFLLFSGYMALVSMTITLMMGFLGLMSALLFNKLLYKSIKLE